MNREEYLIEKELPDYMKEFKRLTDDFFNIKNYLKQKEEPEPEKQED